MTVECYKFLSIYKNCGAYSEQTLESLHSTWNNISSNYKNVPGWKLRTTKIMQAATIVGDKRIKRVRDSKNEQTQDKRRKKSNA